MKIHFNIMKICLLALMTVIFSSMSVFAAQNSLSGIDVSQTDTGEYKIILKLDKKTQVKKILNGTENLTVLLSSTLPSDAMDIVYDNAYSLANVMVQKKNKDNTLILFEGDNINKSQIFIKEISTGILKPIDNNVLGNIFFIADKKLFLVSFVSVFLIFFMMLVSRPKSKRYSSYKVNNTKRSRKPSGVNTLRNKNLVQSRYVPSINSGINGSFNSAKRYMTAPSELVANDIYEDEQIRKAG